VAQQLAYRVTGKPNQREVIALLDVVSAFLFALAEQEDRDDDAAVLVDSVSQPAQVG
jgi:hypothetical protein